jgi:uncharacterized membrane protein YraQ (UPF0718 family)
MLKQAFGGPFLIFAGLASIIGIAVYVLFGWEAMGASLIADTDLLAYLLPNLAAALLIAAFLQVLLPPNLLARFTGEASGLKGIAISTAAGALTPGGPMTSFPLMLVLRQGGTGSGPLVSYITSWSTMGLQRVFVWEVPLMGVEFAAIRFLASAPLPFIAGLLARHLSKTQGREVVATTGDNS